MKQTRLIATHKRVGTYTRDPWRIHFRRADNVTVLLGSVTVPKHFAQHYAKITGRPVELTVSDPAGYADRVICVGTNDQRTLTL